MASNPANVSPLQFQQANSLTNATVDTSASGPNSPADTSGAVGPDSLVVFDSNTYQVIDKFDGTVSQNLTLNQFWNVALGADLPAGDTVFQPRAWFTIHVRPMVRVGSGRGNSGGLVGSP